MKREKKLPQSVSSDFLNRCVHSITYFYKIVINLTLSWIWVRYFDQLQSHEEREHDQKLPFQAVFLKVGTLYPRLMCSASFPHILEASNDVHVQDFLIFGNYLTNLFFHPILAVRKVLKRGSLPKSNLTDSEFSLWPTLLVSCESQE